MLSEAKPKMDMETIAGSKIEPKHGIIRMVWYIYMYIYIYISESQYCVSVCYNAACYDKHNPFRHMSFVLSKL